MKKEGYKNINVIIPEDLHYFLRHKTVDEKTSMNKLVSKTLLEAFKDEMNNKN